MKTQKTLQLSLPVIFIMLFFIITTNAQNVSDKPNVRMYIVIDDPDFVSSVKSQNSENAELIKANLKTPGKDGVRLIRTDLKAYNDVLSKYSVKKFHQAFPTAKSEYLRKVYYIESDREEIGPDLQKQLGKVKIPDIDILYKPTLTYTPNDYSLYHDVGDYYYLDVIHAKEAWDIVKDMSPVKVAVNDTYFDPNHEDLHFEEIRGANNVNTYASEHGTLVAGLISATINNGIGIASISGFNTKLTASSNWANNNEILLLAQQGNRVINCSWLNGCAYNSIVDSLYKEIRKVWNAIVVFGAGNGAENCGSLSAKVYPASYENCVSVTSVSHLFNHGYLDANGRKKYWVDVHESYAGEGISYHHNDAVDICAPGYYLKTTDISGLLGTSSDNYAHGWGTSFAAPLVSGVAAMIIAVNPCLTADEAVDILLSTADATIYDIPENKPYIGLLGSGRLNAYKAVKKALDLGTEYVQNTTFTNTNAKIIQAATVLKAGYSVTGMIPSGNVIVNTGSNVTFKAHHSIELDAGFEVKLGATFNAEVYESSCF